MPHEAFTEPTTEYWQEILPLSRTTPAPWKYGYPARLPDERSLMLPIRALNSDEAVASLIINQAAIGVTDELGDFLLHQVRSFNPDVIVGLPTLGLSLAPIIAKGLGHSKTILLIYALIYAIKKQLLTYRRTICTLGILAKVLVHRLTIHRSFIHHFPVGREETLPRSQSGLATEGKESHDHR